MTGILEKINNAKAVLDKLPPLKNGSLERLDEDFSIGYTYNSNAIEGSTLSARDTYLILKDEISPANAPIKDINAAIGHQKAYHYVKEHALKGEQLSESIIKGIHRLVMMHQPEIAGQYREVGVYIQGSDVVMPSASAVPERMRRLLERYQLNDAGHLIQRVALFHLKFESIHPFEDGNGRTGRLIMNYELLSSGYMPIDIKKDDAPRYYDAFRQYQGSDESSLAMEYMVAEYVLAALNERISQVEQAVEIRQHRDIER